MTSTGFESVVLPAGEIKDAVVDDEVKAGRGAVCSDLALALDLDLDLISDSDSRYVVAFLNLGCGWDLVDSEDEPPGFALGLVGSFGIRTVGFLVRLVAVQEGRLMD